MVGSTMVIGNKIGCMDMVAINTLMVSLIMVILIRTVNMGMESISGPMAENMMDNGSMENSMDKRVIQIVKVCRKTAFGIMDGGRNGL